MILDLISNLSDYSCLNKHFSSVYSYLRSVDLVTLPEGKYIIDGEDIFMTVVEAELRSKENALLETHNEYIDIQIVISGDEVFGWRARSECTQLRDDYCSKNDISFYTDMPSSYISLSASQMVVFFSGDAHAPLVGSGVVRKCIIKVRNL